MRKNILMVLFVLLAVIFIGLVVYRYTYPKPVSQSVVAQSVTPEQTTLSKYTNSELHFSFSYPSKLGTDQASFDSNTKRVGEQFSGNFSNNDSNLGVYFGASSLNYDPMAGRGVGLADMFRDMNINTSSEIIVSDIQSDSGVKGKLIVGTDKCVDMCPFSQMLAAVFPLSQNDKGIKVMGIFANGMTKDEFVKIASTFTVSGSEDVVFNVPEFKIQFTKIPGFTVHYVLDDNDKSVYFYTDELVKAAIKDTSFEGCAVGAFSPLTLSTVPKSQTDYQGYAQYDLGNGKYLNSQGMQAPCYGVTPSKASLDVLDSQHKLYSKFIESVRSY